MSDEWLKLNAERVQESAVRIRELAAGLWNASIPENGDPAGLGPAMQGQVDDMNPLLGRSADAVAGAQSSFGAALLAAVDQYLEIDQAIPITAELPETE